MPSRISSEDRLVETQQQMQRKKERVEAAMKIAVQKRKLSHQFAAKAVYNVWETKILSGLSERKRANLGVGPFYTPVAAETFRRYILEHFHLYSSITTDQKQVSWAVIDYNRSIDERLWDFDEEKLPETQQEESESSDSSE